MLKVYLYRIKLLDPLFYAREGLWAAFTPHYLHATAVNLAITSALNIYPDKQPLLITDDDTHRNIPKYSSSLINDNFYFTPARLITPIKYFPEITKGENDGHIVKAGRATMGELFQAGTLYYISPESIFEGYLIEKSPYSWPHIIRLGSFRGKASLSLIELEILHSLQSLNMISYPVDPLVTPVKRGVLINMFPYPLVENAQSSYGVLAKNVDGSIHIIAFPQTWGVPKIETIKGGKKPVII